METPAPPFGRLRDFVNLITLCATSNENSGFIGGRIAMQAVITCPECGHKESEEIPTDACLFFYECLGCHTLLRPKKGDCCVFCSYCDRKCPSALKEGDRQECCGA
jgi:hypothetical protein